jgi:hypothetical protein
LFIRNRSRRRTSKTTLAAHREILVRIPNIHDFQEVSARTLLGEASPPLLADVTDRVVRPDDGVHDGHEGLDSRPAAVPKIRVEGRHRHVELGDIGEPDALLRQVREELPLIYNYARTARKLVQMHPDIVQEAHP